MVAKGELEDNNPLMECGKLVKIKREGGNKEKNKEGRKEKRPYNVRPILLTNRPRVYQCSQDAGDLLIFNFSIWDNIPLPSQPSTITHCYIMPTFHVK